MSEWLRMPPDGVPVYLALHGAVVLVVSFVAGLLLHRSIRLQTPSSGSTWTACSRT